MIRAATDPSVCGGEFYGPDGRFGLTGMPAPTRAARLVYDRELQRRVWADSERLTGVRYALCLRCAEQVAAREGPGCQARCPSR